ncbi:hypothetical protein WP12_22070 [Sphingomonas sp. SRS2]|nr:hypothetical protein WP12_22070 [Sphingomonas sp. SRS2]
MWIHNQVQQLLFEGFDGSFEVEALSRSVVVSACEQVKLICGDEIEVGFSWQEAPGASDGVFDATLLPGAMRVAEEGLDADLCELTMPGKLWPVIECQGGAECGRQGGEAVAEHARGDIGPAV